MAVKKEQSSEIPEAKIRNAIWYQKQGKTKKFICEYLGISYNTKRLDKIIADFLAQQERTKELKKKAKLKVFTEQEKKQIAKQYQNGESISSISEANHISSTKVKSFIIEAGVPIRARKKNAPAKTDHVKQDLDVKFNKGDRVFYAPDNSFAYIEKVLDEEYIDYLRGGSQKYIETCKFTSKSEEKFSEPVEGIHYEIYWILENGEQWKLSAIKDYIKQLETHIEYYGRESYNIYVDNDYKYRKSLISRHDLFPVITS